MSRTTKAATKQPPAKNARTISVETLTAAGAKAAKLEIPKWVDDKEAAIHGWTRAQGEGAAAKDKKFKVVGVRSTKESTTGKPSKLSTYWRMTTAEEKWEEDPTIIYITSAPVSSFMESFPGRYRDSEDVEPETEIPLWIAGPRAGVIKNLVHAKILPGPGADVAAYNQQMDDWINAVAITYENAPDHQELLDELVLNDKQFVKKSQTEEVAIDLPRLRRIEYVASHLTPARGALVKIIDVNGGTIGTYGGQTEKSIDNIFTDYIVDRVKRGANDFGAMSVDISGLSNKSGSGRIVKRSTVNLENIAEGNYGTTKRRPLDLRLTVFIDGEETLVLDRFTLATDNTDAVAALFAELNAVNRSDNSSVRYEIDGEHSNVQRLVNNLLASAKDKNKGIKKTQQETELNDALLYKASK